MNEIYEDCIPALSGFLVSYPRYRKYDMNILGELFDKMTLYAIQEDMIPAELWLDMYSKECRQKKTALFDAESIIADMTSYLISFFKFERADPADFAPDIRRIVKRHLSCGGRVDPSRVESVSALIIKNLSGDGVFSTIELFRRISADPLLYNCDPGITGAIVQDIFNCFEKLGILMVREDIE